MDGVVETPPSLFSEKKYVENMDINIVQVQVMEQPRNCRSLGYLFAPYYAFARQNWTHLIHASTKMLF